jgi:hypothetical protein
VVRCDGQRAIVTAIGKLLDKVNEIIPVNGRVIAGAVSANLGLQFHQSFGRQCTIQLEHQQF